MLFDLYVTWNPLNANSILDEAAQLGYNGVAFVTRIDDINGSTFKSSALLESQKKLDQDDGLKNGSKKDWLQVKGALDGLSLHFPPSHGDMIQIKRLHVSLNTTPEFNNYMAYMRTISNTSPTAVNAFDLVSVGIKDERIWHLVLQQPICDIIVLDLYSPRLPFALKRSQVQLAARNHIYFEINLEKALIDPQSCKNLFRNLPLLLRYLPPNRLVVSSGASTPMQLRSPRDLVPLMQMMGLGDPNVALSVLEKNALQLLSRGASRRTQGPAFSKN
eukprot:Blabericola_migrator_1__1291@NODE_1335_length_4774_cov_1415_738050_g897_i0_p3_GENE_NODE_1335_length_4774_cov_1415_738050_g897_i0NODE_1335_length_4774_cov_1415_738050_g897_i0_p3_ORF_typecomplete_len275_score40_76RNase_P_p30/PF01876_16/1_5e40CBM49/PF09478_10/0_074_NODE_1335_length_4774_cov_1415_738050_g897_i035974421